MKMEPIFWRGMLETTASIKSILALILVLNLCVQSGDARIRSYQEFTFPDNFIFGAATAAYQIEGAWNISGKGESVWDRWTHEHPEVIRDGTNADVASGSYYNYRQDAKMLKDLGVNFYRFSISWPRLLPNGFANTINSDGIAYYNNLINELIKNNVTPMATLYHWDLPQRLQDLGGWSNPHIVEYFADYARIAFTLFADRVPIWTTFNEPMQTCLEGYGLKNRAPALNHHGIGEYLCTHYLLKSHARAYRIYEKEFRPKYNGKVGITLDSNWAEPKTNSTSDKEAAEVYLQSHAGWYAFPIFSEKGDYSPLLVERVAESSRKQGYPRSRLPRFTTEEVDYIRGSADYFGLNHYTSYLLSWGDGPVGQVPSHANDVGIVRVQDPNWPSGASSDWLRVAPWGFRKLLNWIKDRFNNTPVMVTENGFSDFGDIQDYRRATYHQMYIHALLQAVHLDGCNVIAYSPWSLMDNFEWERGYSERFGLYHVDYNSPNRTRTPKYSAKVYTDIIRNRRLTEDFDPDDFSVFYSSGFTSSFNKLMILLVPLLHFVFRAISHY